MYTRNTNYTHHYHSRTPLCDNIFPVMIQEMSYSAPVDDNANWLAC